MASVRHCAICEQSFPTEKYPSRRAAAAALNGHLGKYHAEYARWSAKWSRIIAIFPMMLVIDFIVFSAKVNGQLIIGPFQWWVVVVIIGLELLGGVWLVRTTYRRGLGRLKLAWQGEHPVGFVEGVEALGPSFSVADNQGPEENGLLDAARELCTRLNITKLQLGNLSWVGGYIPMGRGGKALRPDQCYFGPGNMMVPQALKGKLNLDEWKPLIASSLIFDRKQGKLIGRLIVGGLLIVLGVLVLLPLGLYAFGLFGLILVIPLVAVAVWFGHRTRRKILLEADSEAVDIVGREMFLESLRKIDGLSIHVSNPTIADRIKAVQSVA